MGRPRKEHRERNIPLPNGKTGRIRVPFINQPGQSGPIERVIMAAAEAMNTEPVWIAIALSYVMEGIIREVGKGNVVKIPTFGMFGPRTRFRHVTSKIFGRNFTTYPAFNASMLFKYLVRMQVPAAQSRETDYMAKAQKLNSYRKGRGGQTDPDRCFRNFRKALQDWNYPKKRCVQKKKIAA